MPGENANPTPTPRSKPAAARPRRVGFVRHDVVLADEALVDRLLQSGVRRVVERLVTETADVERDPDADVAGAVGAGATARSAGVTARAVPAAAAVVVAAARCPDDRQYGEQNEESPPPFPHALPHPCL